MNNKNFVRESMVETLFKTNRIGRRMFSIYTSLSDEAKPIIKFGGYDQELVAPEHRIMILRTYDKNSWAVRFSDFKFGEDEVNFPTIDKDRVAVFNPAYPWIHIPSNDMKAFVQYFN